MQLVSYLAEGEGVIWHPDGGRVLVVDAALPHFEVRHSAYKGQGVADALSRDLDLRLNVLRRLSFKPVAAEPIRHSRYVFELEWLSGDPRRFAFVDPIELEGRLDGGALENLLARASPLRPDWQQRGWRAATEDWLEGALGEAGLERAGELELVHNWQISGMYTIPTRRGKAPGKAFLKAVPPYFAREVPLTAWLDATCPGAGPAVITADAAGARLLMASAGEPAVSAGATERLMRRLPAIQRATVGRETELLALGCLDRRLPALAEHARELLADDSALAVGAEHGLTTDEAAEVRALAPRLWEACDRLEELGLPATLVHGDLHMGNVVERDGRPVILDWSDGALGHPFLDAHPAYLMHDEAALDQAAVNRLRDAYLDGWTGVLPPQVLREAFALAQPLAELHLAVGNARFIVPNLEDPVEFAEAAPHHLRQSLRLLRDLPASSR